MLSNAQIIETELKSMVYSYLSQATKKIEARVRQLLGEAIRNTDHYRSLIGGELQAHFGLTNPVEKLDQIIGVIQSGCKVTMSTGKQGHISILLTAVPENFFDLIFLEGASQQVDNYEMNWLRLLLLSDTQIVVEGFYVDAPNLHEVQYSRTGRAIMRKKKGSSWHVPAHWAGSQNNNFLTELCDSIQSEVGNIMRDALR